MKGALATAVESCVLRGFLKVYMTQKVIAAYLKRFSKYRGMAQRFSF